jgi:hypothetical protein
MATHFIMQSKGGAGKSTIASYMFQYFQERGDNAQGFDIDPSNHTFAGYKSFNVTRIEIMTGTEIDPLKFDSLMTAILELPVDSQIVVDVGASGFSQLSSYLLENDVFTLLADEGYSPVIHSIVVGGAPILDSVSAVVTVVNAFAGVPLAVWINPYFGPAEYKGIPYYKFAAWEGIQDKISGVIQIPLRNQATFGVDLREMASRRLSFAEAFSNEGGFGLMPRQRLKAYWRDLYGAIGRGIPHMEGMQP